MLRKFGRTDLWSIDCVWIWMTSDGVPLKEGWLFKAPRSKGEDSLRKGWKYRYFVLGSGKLVYCKSKGDKKYKGELNLQDISVVDTEKTNVFKICEFSKNCFTYLKAPSNEEKVEWIEAIQDALLHEFHQMKLRSLRGAEPLAMQSFRKSISALNMSQSLSFMPEKTQNFHETITGDLMLLPENFPVRKSVVFETASEKSGPGEGRMPQENAFSKEYVEDLKDFDGQGILISDDGIRYEGTWKKGIQHGFGTLTYPSGAMYIGTWKNGKRHGQGIMLSTNGCKYDGEFYDGKHHGEGTLIWPNGNKYIGSFLNDTGHGKGLFIYCDGMKYDGEFKMGKFNGKGKITFTDDRVYEGMFNMDKYEGPGTLYLPNGDVYEGHCKKQLRHGNGKMKFRSGATYVGSWKNDQMHGYGKLESPDGYSYEGKFSNGERHGKGILKFPDGRRYEGFWENGIIHGQGTMIYENGNVYIGGWSRGLKHGKGIFSWPDGRRFDGEYVNGKPNGLGNFSTVNGEKYTGYYVDGKKHGKGMYVFSNGDTYEGDWDQNFMHGQGSMYYADGSKYKGEWTKDARGRNGQFAWANGDTFEGCFGTRGEFVAGVIHYANRNRYEGEVNSIGKRHGVGVMFWENGDRFEGHWKIGKRHGFGVMYMLDGRVTEGLYEHDRCTDIVVRELNSEEMASSPVVEFAIRSSQAVSIHRDVVDSIRNSSVVSRDANIIISDTVAKSEFLKRMKANSKLSKHSSSSEDVDYIKNDNLIDDTANLPEMRRSDRCILETLDDELSESTRFSFMNVNLTSSNDSVNSGHRKSTGSRIPTENASIQHYDFTLISSSTENIDQKNEIGSTLNFVCNRSETVSFSVATNDVLDESLTESRSSLRTRSGAEINLLWETNENTLSTLKESADEQSPGKNSEVGDDLEHGDETCEVLEFQEENEHAGVLDELQTLLQDEDILNDIPPPPPPSEDIPPPPPPFFPHQSEDVLLPRSDFLGSLTDTQRPGFRAVPYSTNLSTDDGRHSPSTVRSSETKVSLSAIQSSLLKDPLSEESLNLIPLSDWDSSQASIWLKRNKFDYLGDVFDSKHYCGKHLNSIQDIDSFSWLQELNLTFLQKRNLLFALEELRNRQRIKIQGKSGAVHRFSIMEMNGKLICLPTPIIPEEANLDVNRLLEFWERNASWGDDQDLMASYLTD